MVILGGRQASSDTKLRLVSGQLGKTAELERNRKGLSSSWYNVFHSVEITVQWGREHQDLEDVGAIGVYEMQWQGGQKYITVAYQIDSYRKRLPWVGKDRKKATFNSCFDRFSKTRTQTLQFVCSDIGCQSPALARL